MAVIVSVFVAVFVKLRVRGHVRGALDLTLTAFAGPLKDNEEFLHKYMTLTRCDLLFADKAILIEGTSERLLLPKMIELLDAGKAPGQGLSSQYVTTMEVGGAHAHLFLRLIDFLEVPSLIVTDLDTVKKNAKGKLVVCPVSNGVRTSNTCIKKWFGDDEVEPKALLAKKDSEKTSAGCRLAYQVPEEAGRPCGRSLEQAFILANPSLFQLGDTPTEEESWDLAGEQKKSDFALHHAVTQSGWRVPRYIAEGLAWLAASGTSVSDTAALVPDLPTDGATSPSEVVEAV